MRLHVVSDVHGQVPGLAAAMDGADALVCLGDLVLFVDYDDHARGIFPDLFGAAAASRLIALRAERRFDEAREFSARLWAGVGDRRFVIEQAVRRQYAELFAAMPTPAYLTYGNVDLPHLWSDYLREGHHLFDGAATDIGGRRVGFVGGGLRTPMRTPFEVSDEEYAAKVAALGPVDVLCTHIPPADPLLCYDVVGRRMERGSTAVIDYVRTYQPSLVLFGHVHNPLHRRTRIGRTECVNVGHFRATGTPFVLEW